MKKLSLILAALMTATMLFVGAGCSDDDGPSASELILTQTGDQWYQYTTNASVSGSESDSSSSQALGKAYIKYDTTNGKLILVACSDNYYATNEKELSVATWIGGVTAATLAKKITKSSSDPTKGKKEITVSNWGDLAVENVITAIFGN